MLVDSHCHLDRLAYGKKHTDIKDVINKAQEKGIKHLLSVCVTLDDYPAMAELISPFEQPIAMRSAPYSTHFRQASQLMPEFQHLHTSVI